MFSKNKLFALHYCLDQCRGTRDQEGGDICQGFPMIVVQSPSGTLYVLLLQAS